MSPLDLATDPSPLYVPASWCATATDIFCGAGGSTSGFHSVPGLKVVMAANHWQLAVDTHNTNHQETDHDCADVSQVDPRRYPRTDIAWFSPECTNHSKAKGQSRKLQTEGQGDLFDEAPLSAEAEERSRATMWDVVRFAEYHRYRYIVVENVPDVVDWVMFPAWRMATAALGYEMRIVSANSMFAHAVGDPAPQSRDRVYIVLWRRGERVPDFNRWLRPTSWCEHCEEWVQAVQAWKNGRTVGAYGPQYVWRCPRIHRIPGKVGDAQWATVTPPYLPGGVAVDWSIKGTPIGERKHPLKPATMRRIVEGRRKLRRFVGGQEIAIANGGPMFVPVEARAGRGSARPVSRIMRAMTTRNETALVVPPLVAELRGTGTHRALAEPLSTFTAGGRHHGLTLDPDTWDVWAGVYNYSTRRVRSPGEPLRTMTCVQGDAVLTSTAGAEVPIEQVLFRMLGPDEAKRAMGLAAAYVLLGTKREQQKLAGNAVTPPVARDLGFMLMEALTGEQIARTAA
jgi:DNA (cytosine-5)-methyltransferase 1